LCAADGVYRGSSISFTPLAFAANGHRDVRTDWGLLGANDVRVFRAASDIRLRSRWLCSASGKHQGQRQGWNRVVGFHAMVCGIQDEWADGTWVEYT
jgi:hypothetical protein